MRRRGGKGKYKIPSTELQNVGTKSNSSRKPKKLPEYLEGAEVESLMMCAPSALARLCMMIQWRAGLRVSEAIALTPADIHLNANPPELKVRQGKGSKDRLVPLHPDLAGVLAQAVSMWKLKASDPLIGGRRQVPWRWVKEALTRCNELGTIPEGKPCGTHTLRHSAARYWLMNGVPINVVSKWLGHANLQTTMVYAQLVSDPGGFMERVP